MRRKIVNLVIFLVSVGLIVSLSRDIWRLLKAGDRVKEAQLKVEKLEREQAELQAKKEFYQSEEFIEEQARDKLNLAKEGETVVILPENVRELVSSDFSSEPEKTPNWQQWWRLFF